MARGDDIIFILRELIASGALAPGERLVEIAVAARLGVSRTPVRTALAQLAAEGLLATAGARGYLVRAFTIKDILDSIEVRGQLEGMAARLVAENGPTEALLNRLEACVTEGGRNRRAPLEDDAADGRWARLNKRFHSLIMSGCGNLALVEALSRNDKLPFAAVSSLAGTASGDSGLRELHREVLRQAHFQHRVLIDAFKQRHGMRAEAVMREHALLAHRNLKLFREANPSLGDLPNELRVFSSVA